MQTFLPYPDFTATAAVLDHRRLGNQRSETLVILRACLIPTYGWQNHPAVRMWRGHEEALVSYGVAICDCWVELGYGDTVKAKLLGTASGAALLGAASSSAPTQAALVGLGRLPPWLGDDRIHRSHQSALLRKDPGWYGRHFADVPDDLPYYWPV